MIIETTAIESALRGANGKRRTRIATLSDVLRVIERVAKGEDGAGLRATFGTVANSYGYRAMATRVTAVKVDGKLRVKIDEGRAASVAHGGSDYVESARNNDVSALLKSADGAIVLDVQA